MRTPEKGNLVTLTPLTKYGKDRINAVRIVVPDWNEKWAVQDVMDSVAHAKGERGPWLLVKPVGDFRNVRMRWVHATRDENFTVKETT